MISFFHLDCQLTLYYASHMSRLNFHPCRTLTIILIIIIIFYGILFWALFYNVVVSFQSMLTGLLYNKPKDHLQFLGECISSAKTNPNIKWDTFLDLNKKPLPAIPKTTDGPIRSESYSLQEPSLEQKTFPTEPVLEMKIQTKLPAIKKGNGNSMDSVDSLDGDVTTEKHISTNGGDDDMPFQLKQFEKQRVIFVLGKNK